ncbi:Uncharacterised protein [uncultured archaeon]|nr:Uncharacterised protein [uncultured archaeon]
MKEKRHRETILKLLEQKDVSLAELKLKTSRQAVHYHLSILYKEGRIRPYITGLGLGLKDSEIFYSIKKSYENPQEISELIDKLRNRDNTISEPARSEFIGLYMKKARKKIEDDTNEKVNHMKERRISVINQGIKQYDDTNFNPWEQQFEFCLRLSKEGLTREKYVQKIKEGIEFDIQYNHQDRQNTILNRKDFKVIDPSEFDKIFEERILIENTEIAEQNASHIACALMSDTSSDLKKRVVFSMIHNGGYDLLGVDRDGEIKPYSEFLPWYVPAQTSKNSFKSPIRFL